LFLLPESQAGRFHAQATARPLLYGSWPSPHPSPRVRAATDTMPSWFQTTFHIQESNAAIRRVAVENPQRITDVVLAIEDSRKKGWSAFFEMLRGRVRDWQRDGVRRANLTATHREVQNSRFVVGSFPPHFLKMIQLGYEAMIAKWGECPPEISHQLEALGGMLTQLEANGDTPALEAALKGGIAALQAQKPEQESEPCMICCEPVLASEVFGDGQGIIFSPQCMHSMHESCFQAYVNNPPPGNLQWGENGTPLDGKKIPCPSCRDGVFTKQYVENFRAGRDLGRKEKGEESARARKRDAEEMAATDADPDAEVLEGEAPEGEEDEPAAGPRLRLKDDPVKVDGCTPEVVQKWIARKVRARHYRFLEARHKNTGVLYQFVIDGSEGVYPRNKAIKMVYTTIHDPSGKYGAKDNFNLANPKNGKPLFARGRPLPGGAAQSSAAGSSA
jgi:hypothetical protein